MKTNRPLRWMRCTPLISGVTSSKPPVPSAQVTRPGFAHFDGRPLRGGTEPGKFDRFFARGAIEQEEPSDHLAGFGEGAVAQAALAAADLQALAFGVVAQRRIR